MNVKWVRNRCGDTVLMFFDERTASAIDCIKEEDFISEGFPELKERVKNLIDSFDENNYDSVDELEEVIKEVVALEASDYLGGFVEYERGFCVVKFNDDTFFVEDFL